MKEILVDEQIVMIDDEDYDYITGAYNITINNRGYVYCKPKYRNMGLFSMTLHKILINPDKTGRSINIDHKDGNKLNNQKSNLRECSHHDNMKNRKPHNTYAQQEVSSQYKGVYWNERDGKWIARLTTEKNKQKHLGLFKDEVSAANCYNWHCEREYGEFAMLNDCPYMIKEEWEKNQYKKNTSSKYRGVTYDKKWNKWLMQIMHKGKNYSERFNSELEAAKKYNELALRLKGDKAKLNIINT